MASLVYESLRNVKLFDDLSDDDLEHLCASSEEVHLAKGAELFDEGDPGDRAFVITDGEIEIIKQSSGREVLLAVRKAPEVIGEMALLEASPRMATARARTDATLITIPKPALDELLEVSTSAVRAMFHTILGRLRDTEGQLRQSERMAQLGTLTAGVAHELNNPAAGVKRAADLLRETVTSCADARERLVALGLEPAARAAVDELLATAMRTTGRPEALDALACSDREARIEDWLDDRGVADPWDLAPGLMHLGLDTTDLDGLAGLLGESSLAVAFRAVVSTYELNSLLHQVEEGSFRMSEIVKALKSYSYLDQAPVQNVDVTEGIDDTMLILAAKLRGLQVVRDYASALPRIEAYGSELNQVWTNLLANAADAITDAAVGGTIVVRAFAADDMVVVEVEDDGPGIPAEIIDRIFDSFFTTKPPGKGTGLGLDISYGIVVNRHRGDLTVRSEPGGTVFRVELPTTLDAR